MQVGLLRRQLEEAKNTSGSFEEGTESADNCKSGAKAGAPRQSDTRGWEELPLVNEPELFREAERQDLARRRPPSDTQSLTRTAFPSLLHLRNHPSVLQVEGPHLVSHAQSSGLDPTADGCADRRTQEREIGTRSTLVAPPVATPSLSTQSDIDAAMRMIELEAAVADL